METTEESDMDTPTETTPSTELTIRGRTFTVQGPTPRYGTFYLTGPRGATFITAQAYIGDEHTLKVIAWNGQELYIKGNRVLLTDEAGTLQVLR